MALPCMPFTLDIKTLSFSSLRRGGTLARMSEEPENWRRRVYRPGYEISDELAAMLEERMADDDAPPECLFPDDPKVQRPQRNGYTRDENILREWHREVFGESLWIDSELHEAIRKRTIEFRRNRMRRRFLGIKSGRGCSAGLPHYVWDRTATFEFCLLWKAPSP
jgi:hypothetical protein